MIVTFTANPSLDRTARLDAPLVRGGVARMRDITAEPGGKGVNVARAIHLAGRDVLAVVPADEHDPLLAGMEQRGLPFRAVPMHAPVRANLTLTEADGTTTKLNEPGAHVTPAVVNELSNVLIEASGGADWVVLSGSIPPGAPVDWYARLVARLHELGVKVAVDTSDRPLKALATALPQAAPDVIKPNSEELGQLCGQDGAALESEAEGGNLSPVLDAASSLVDNGIGAVLVTLGSAGALLVNRDGAWRACAPKITVKSTVGAGDSSLAGYLLAETDGLSAPERLQRAVAYGSGAAALDGSALPSPDQIDPSQVSVTQLSH